MYVTQEILEAELGAAVVARLTRSNAATLARLIRSAQARVATALTVGGYGSAVPATVYASDASDCPDEITDLSVRVWKRLAYERSDLSIPEDQIRAIEKELLDVENGRFEVKGLSRDVARQPGGVTGSNATDSSGERYRPRMFGRDRMGGW